MKDPRRQVDPSRTKTLRRVFEREVTRRYRKVARAIVHLLTVEDAFGLKGVRNVDNQRFEFLSTVQQKEAFEKWLEKEMSDVVLTGDYWEEYIRQGYAKGAGRVFDDTRKVQRATAITPRQIGFMEGSKQQFLLDAFGRPESIEKVQLLASRVFTDLKGVSNTVSTQLSRVLVDGLVQGQHPMIIAKNMVGPDSPLQKIGINRARMIARTEIIRSHAEGQLDGLEKLGVDKVGVMVEWSTAGDDRVCSLCMSLEGVVLKIKEARGILPRHTNCRCAFLPANVSEGPDATRRVNYGDGVIDVGQVRGKKAIQASIRRSVEAERIKGSFASKLKRSRWAGSSKVSRS